MLKIREGELAPPMYATALGCPVVLLLYALAMYLVVHEPQQGRVCHFSRLKPSGPVTHHPGCRAEPVYTSRDECPACFPSSVVTNFSDDLFQPYPEKFHLFPRGPAHILKPHTSRQQSLVQGALMVPERVCVDTCPYLVVLVISSAKEWEARAQIRQTWASVARTKLWPDQGPMNAQVDVMFVLAGVDQLELDELNSVQDESDLFHDILFLKMVDIYSNLALKVASALHWAVQHCHTSRFFLKIDLDTFLNVPLLVNVLVYHERRLGLSVLGHIYSQARTVRRTGRWAVGLLEYPMTQYPLYAAGCAYVMSRTTAERLVLLFPYFPRFVIEDAFLTGLLAREAGVQHFSPAHNQFFAEFYSDYTDDWCKFLRGELITMTGVSTKQMRLNLWSNLVFNQWLCKVRPLHDVNPTCRREFPGTF